MDGLPSASAIRLAEGQMFKNICRAYPLGLAPDTNPRITSLALTHIPAHSTGPVIEKLIQFLELACVQQKAIRHAGTLFDGRKSSVLKGLRHIRFELDPKFSESNDIISTSSDVDFDKILDPGEENFNEETTSGLFDDDVTFGITSRSAPKKAQVQPKRRSTSADEYPRWTSGRLKSPPYSDVSSEYVTCHVDATDSWSGNFYSVPVWIGSGHIGPHAAINEYMWNVQDPNLRTNIGPATPNHIAAGVPPMTYIFYAAWEAMIIPKNSAIREAAKSSIEFRDVAGAIKEYRLQTKGSEEHWDGKLELVRTGG
ncbi:hypothetical protein PC116_g29959 [Phytophthora cactorum]|nr:hypothetical protein PC116_g29959 [Phytophthora cactorum]